jgi:triose/dihydroxyacetone kinase / FAD-AMP lyase (cyclizing)
VMKILGSLAEQGGSLEELYRLGQTLSGNLVSIGASLLRVTVPGRELPGEQEQVPAGQVEVGMGIHNETGTGRTAAGLPELVQTMLAHLLDKNDDDRHFIDLTPSDKVVVLINNLGGLSPLELSAVAHEFCTQAEQRYGIVPVRVLCGTFLTSLNAPGWSATILKVFETGLGPCRSLLELLDAPAQAPAWPSAVDYTPVPTEHDRSDGFPLNASTANAALQSNLTLDPEQAAVLLSQGLRNVIAAEPEITYFDSVVGDGDCGIGLKRGSEAILAHICSTQPLSADPVTFLNDINVVIENTMDGTSGAIIAIFVSAMSAAMRNIGAQVDASTRVDAKIWGQAVQSAVQSLKKYTPATLGDRTMLDSLIPFVNTLLKTEDIHKAATAAAESAVATKDLEPRLGRTTYLGSRDRWLGVIPDPGAIGLAKLFTGMAGASRRVSAT